MDSPKEAPVMPVAATGGFALGTPATTVVVGKPDRQDDADGVVNDLGPSKQ